GRHSPLVQSLNEGEGRPDYRHGPALRHLTLESAVVPEDPEAVVTIAGRDILLPAMVEDLDAPEVIAVLVDVVAFLDDLVIHDLGDTEAARVVREVEPVGYLVRGRHLVYREVAEPICEGRVVCLGDGVGV